MFKLLLLALVILLLSGSVSAANPDMDYALTVNPRETFFHGPDTMFNPICDFCTIPFYQCIHAVPSLSPYIPARSLHTPPEPYDDPSPNQLDVHADLMPVVEYVTGLHQHQVIGEEEHVVASGETMVQGETVQAHVEDIYTPGDRMKPKRGCRSSPIRRQAPRPGGYGCDVDGCNKTFDRACELNRHQRNTHTDRSKRPHKCNACNEGFLYPKDLQRHQRKHIEQPSAQVTFFCQLPGCHNHAFTRRDNLLRHQRRQHPSIVAM